MKERLDRRVFLKAAGAASVAGLAGTAEAAPRADSHAWGVLVDTTRCVGCRACEAACSEANDLPGPERPGEAGVFDDRRETTTTRFTVVNRGTTAAPGGEARFAKTQCLHCVEPACASACPVRALEKRPDGPVVYHPERCMGCRYCMVACPFRVPRYEYDAAVPYVRKCSFCAPRLAAGLAPACASVCPSGALEFGPREALLEVARRRVWGEPDRYVHHIYGEHEAGGTSWLYLSDVPLGSLGLPGDVEQRSYPELTGSALAAVPFVLTLWPPFLMALSAFSRRREQTRSTGEEHHE